MDGAELEGGISGIPPQHKCEVARADAGISKLTVSRLIREGCWRVFEMLPLSRTSSTYVVADRLLVLRLRPWALAAVCFQAMDVGVATSPVVANSDNDEQLVIGR